MAKHFQVKFKDKITTLRKTEAGVPQGSVLGPILYLIYTSNILTLDNTTATFANGTALLATTSKIDDWVKKWRITINQSKSTHITFTLPNQT